MSKQMSSDPVEQKKIQSKLAYQLWKHARDGHSGKHGVRNYIYRDKKKYRLDGSYWANDALIYGFMDDDEK